MTTTDKKYIKLFGAAACLFALQVHEGGEGACESHYQTCLKYNIPHKPDKRNRYRIGDGLINAGRSIRKAGSAFRSKYDLP